MSDTFSDRRAILLVTRWWLCHDYGYKVACCVQVAALLSMLPSLDQRMVMASLLGVTELSEVLVSIIWFTEQWYLNWMVGYIKIIGLDRTELIPMMWTRENRCPISPTTKASSVLGNLQSRLLVKATENRTSGFHQKSRQWTRYCSTSILAKSEAEC